MRRFLSILILFSVLIPVFPRQEVRRYAMYSGATSLLSGLIGWWDLDESSGTRIAAYGGSRLNLTQNNGVGSTTGIIGSAATFSSASSQYLNVADTSVLNPTTAASWSVWFKETSLPTLPSQTSLLNKWLYSTQGSWNITTSNASNSDMQVGIASSLGDAYVNYGVTTGAGITAGSWYHLVAIFDGSQSTNATRLKVYINNVQLTMSFTGTIPSSLQSASADFEIGRLSGIGTYWNGAVDLVGFWNRALTPTEISLLYNSGAGRNYPFGGSWTVTSPAGLQQWLKADAGLFQASGCTTAAASDSDPVGCWQDQSGNGNNVTQATSTKRPLLKLAIQNGLQVLQFDGVDDALNNSTALSGQMTFFIVYKVSSLSLGGFAELTTIKNSTFSEWGITHSLSGYDTVSFINDYSSATSVGYNPAFDINWHILIATYNGGTNTSTSSYTLNFDGTTQTVVMSGAFTRTSTDVGSIGSRIDNSGTSSFSLDGYIAEMGVYNNVITSTDITNLKNYLNSRWAVF